jgi:hypothetical protein
MGKVSVMSVYMEPEFILSLAGECVAPGIYQRLDTEMTLHLEHEDFLPASLDGQVACSIRINPIPHRLSSGEAVVKERPRLQEESNVPENTRLR